MDNKINQELQSATFERLIKHLRDRKDVQNIDLMNLSGFCRNCLSKWYKEEADKIMTEVKDIGDRILALDEKADSLLEERDAIRMRIPNLLHEAVPVGGDEGSNTQHSLHGKKQEFDFEPRTHNELIEMNKCCNNINSKSN